MWAIFRGRLLSLSEQQLMDCSKKEGDMSCNGGLMDYAFQYYLDMGGACLEEEYPYQEKDRDMCELCTKIVHIDGFKDIEPNNEKELMKQVAIQPVSVALDSGSIYWQFYRSGIFNHPYACGYNLDHGVVVIGYGTENGQDYWIVRNSWGKYFGEEGYIRLARNVDDKRGMCGIAMQPSYPFVKSNII